MRSSSFYSDLGARVRARRMALHLSQNQLAEQLGLQRTSITNLEKGVQRISAEALVQVARALQVSPVDLLPSDDKADVSWPSSAPRPVLTWIQSAVTTSKERRKNASRKKAED
jgi:transcriptional regulator with XRE-family HTH domain